MCTKFVTKCFTGNIDSNVPVFERSVGKQLYDRALQLTYTRSDVFSNKTDDIFWNCHFQMIEKCLVSKNCNSMFKIRQLDIHDHSPLETAYQTALETGNF